MLVTASKIEQLASLFAKTWQRPPTVDELKGLIDDYAKEEIYAREAVALTSISTTRPSAAACASRWNFSTKPRPMLGACRRAAEGVPEREFR